MDKFKKIETDIEGVIIIEPKLYEDERGFFYEKYNYRDFEKLGIRDIFVQDNCSKSKKGVLRGLHYQKFHSQSKLIRVVSGRILDIVVDLRVGSKTYGEYVSVELSSENKRYLYIPKNMAHGFLTLEEDTEIEYKCGDYYYPQYEEGIIWNDDNLQIDWQLEKYKIDEKDLIISEKDKKNKKFEKNEYSQGKILILGNRGQLGQEIEKIIKERGMEFLGIDLDILDITDIQKVNEHLVGENIGGIINCVAYNDVDKAEIDIEKCEKLNSEIHKFFVEYSKKRDIYYVNYSTDFVFDGKKNKPYLEEDMPSPLSFYGKSKLNGENIVLNYEKGIIIRTSWLFGIGNNNFCKQVLNWAKNNGKLKVVDDQISSPTYAKDLAEYTLELLKYRIYGLFHFSNNGECSKYQQAEYILKKIRWQGELVPVKTEEFRLLGQRPNYSKLDSGKIEKIVGKKIPHWKDGIDRFLNELEWIGEEK